MKSYNILTCYQSLTLKAPFLPRLGLLAVATSTGVVTIYSIPHPDALHSNTTQPNSGKTDHNSLWFPLHIFFAAFITVISITVIILVIHFYKYFTCKNEACPVFSRGHCWLSKVWSQHVGCLFSPVSYEDIGMHWSSALLVVYRSAHHYKNTGCLYTCLFMN